MTNMQEVSLAQYFTIEQELKPFVSKSFIGKQPWILNLQKKTAKYYWKKDKPSQYLKCLCSILVTLLLDKTIYLKIGDTIQAPSICERMTVDFKAIIAGTIEGNYINRHISRSSKSYSSQEWANGQEVNTQVFAHVMFIWSAVSAITDPNLETTSIGRDNTQSLLSCVTCWISYLESMINIMLKVKKS